MKLLALVFLLCQPADSSCQIARVGGLPFAESSCRDAVVLARLEAALNGLTAEGFDCVQETEV
jgi:hypothetical protein